MITVRDIVELVTDDVLDCGVYNLSKDEFVYHGAIADIPEDILDLELCSWDTAEGVMDFNVEKED